MVAMIIAVSWPTPASADPVPPFDLDPIALEARMDACMAYQVGEQEILMGWQNFRTGDLRQWRCSSLRHMILDEGPGRPAHDPFIDVGSFIICADEVVSHGFPRPGDAGYTVLNYQYNGTRSRAIAVVNDDTGDIATIYTTTSNDWIGCAHSLQW
jgi:hypothetical protein